MTSKSCRYSYKVQDRFSTRFSGSIPSRLLSPLLNKLNKLTATQVPPLKSSNRPAATLTGFGAVLGVYTNKDVQDIIWTVLEIRLAATEVPHKRLFKVYFPDVYKEDNYMANYNFYQQCKDYFVIAKAKKPNCISFTASCPRLY